MRSKARKLQISRTTSTGPRIFDAVLRVRFIAMAVRLTNEEKRREAGDRERLLEPTTFTGSRSALECAFAPCSPLSSG